MKKSLSFSLFLVLFLLACSPNKPEDSLSQPQGLDQKTLLTKFLEAKDLESYQLKSQGQVTLYDPAGQIIEDTQYRGLMDWIKKPRAYHSLWETRTNGREESQENYLLGSTSYYRKDTGAWVKEDLNEDKEDVPNFVGQDLLSSSQILGKLEDYFSLSERDKAYFLKLTSTEEDLDKIQRALFSDLEEDQAFFKLQNLEVEFFFNKEDYTPRSFSWRAKFLDQKTKEVKVILQEGHYSQVNTLESIKPPKDLASL